VSRLSVAAWVHSRKKFNISASFTFRVMSWMKMSREFLFLIRKSEGLSTLTFCYWIRWEELEAAFQNPEFHWLKICFCKSGNTHRTLIYACNTEINQQKERTYCFTLSNMWNLLDADLSTLYFLPTAVTPLT